MNHSKFRHAMAPNGDSVFRLETFPQPRNGNLAILETITAFGSSKLEIKKPGDLREFLLRLQKLRQLDEHRFQEEAKRLKEWPVKKEMR